MNNNKTIPVGPVPLTVAVFALLLSFLIVSPASAGTVSFRDFTLNGGALVGEAFQAGAGTFADPDTVTLIVDSAASSVTFQLTVVGSNFTAGTYCELEWDDDAPGVPRDNVAALRGGSFSAVQSFSVPVNRLGLQTGVSRTVLYELDVDEEPYDDRWDTERYLRVVFSTLSQPTPNPNPNPDPGSSTDSGGGGGCGAFAALPLLLPALFLLCYKRK